MTKVRESMTGAKNPRTEPPARRGGGARAVGALLPEVGGMAFRRFGFLQGELVARWAEVVGPAYARWSVPETLRFPRGEKTGGTLVIRVEGAFAIQLQHVVPQIVERTNRIFGHAAVARIRLVQGSVPRDAECRKPAETPAASEESLANLRQVSDDGLRSALEELARQLARTSGPPRIG